MANNLSMYTYAQTNIEDDMAQRMDDATNVRWSVPQYYQAINSAITNFSTRVAIPHLYTITGGYVSGTYEYTLPAYVEGAIDPEFKRIVGIYTGQTDTTDRVWEDLVNYQVDVNASGQRVLRLSYDLYATDGRIFYWAPNGPVPTTATLPVTNAELSATDTSVVLTTIPRVGMSGYIKIDEEIIQYAGLTVGSSTLTLSNLVRAQEGTTSAIHTSGSTVEWCVSVHRIDLYEQLINEALTYLHLVKLNDASQSERSHHESQLLFYQDRADRFWKRYKPGRSTRTRLNRRTVGPGIGNTDYTIARVP